MARKIFDEIKRLPKWNSKDRIVVVRGIKNLAEVQFFRQIKECPFYLFAITADISDGDRASLSHPKKLHTLGRKTRVTNDNEDETTRQYKLDEERDRESKDSNGDVLLYGQQVLRCYQDADAIIDNSFEIADLKKKTDKDSESAKGDKIKSIETEIPDQANKNDCDPFLILKKEIIRIVDYILIKEGLGDKRNRQSSANKFAPFPHEVNMLMAYAKALNSKCLKRQVGAIITNKKNIVISSGYNDVPGDDSTLQPCKNNPDHQGCMRDKERNAHITKTKEYLNEALHRFRQF